MKVPHFVDEKHAGYGGEEEFRLLLRPGLSEMLNALAPHFELLVFTSACASYMKEVVGTIEKNQYSFFDHCLSREHCSTYLRSSTKNNGGSSYSYGLNFSALKRVSYKDLS